MTAKANSQRAGKSLIEVMVVIVTASAILTMAGQLLYRVSRTERATRDAGAISRAELRLVRDLRSDLRAATSADTGEKDDVSRLHLVRAEQDIDYRATDEGIERQTAATRELYRLGDVSARFHREGEFVVLEVEPRRPMPGFAKAAAGRFRIMAAIGADLGRRSTGGNSAVSETPPVEAPLPERNAP
jgi:hypothetical protein